MVQGEGFGGESCDVVMEGAYYFCFSTTPKESCSGY